MYVARLICSDPGCAERAVAEAADLMDLVTRVCGCGCAMDVLGLPDWVDGERGAQVVALHPPASGLDLAA